MVNNELFRARTRESFISELKEAIANAPPFTGTHEEMLKEIKELITSMSDTQCELLLDLLPDLDPDLIPSLTTVNSPRLKQRFCGVSP